MKHLPDKKTVYFMISVFAFTAMFILTVAIGIKALPKVISYEPLTESKKVSVTQEVEAPEDKTPDCQYDSIFDIAEKGPFTIKSENGLVFVFCKDTRLYRVKTNLHNFPEADKKAIMSGINAKSKKELSELIEYMES